MNLQERLANTKGGGGDVHLRLLKKTIEHLHKSNMLVTLPDEDNAPDIIAYPMAKGSKKYLWDDKNRRAYEIQTTARKENILVNRERNKKDGLPTTWVFYDKSMAEQAKEYTKNEDEYLVLKV